MKNLRPIWRLLYFVTFTTAIVAEIWFRNVLQGVDLRRSMRIRRRWATNLLKGIGVELEQYGQIPNYPCILISNHRSYMDPILMLQAVDAYPVAKAELASWPIIGKGAKLAGILYLKRDNVKSRAGTLQHIHEIIKNGYPVIIFPEGTTSALSGTLPFKRGVFQLASKMNIPIVPVAIKFQSPEDYWVGKETFLSHAGRRFRQKRINVSIHYGLQMQGGTPDTLLHYAQSWIDQQLSC